MGLQVAAVTIPTFEAKGSAPGTALLVPEGDGAVLYH